MVGHVRSRQLLTSLSKDGDVHKHVSSPALTGISLRRACQVRLCVRLREVQALAACRHRLVRAEHLQQAGAKTLRDRVCSVCARARRGDLRCREDGEAPDGNEREHRGNVA